MKIGPLDAQRIDPAAAERKPAGTEPASATEPSAKVALSSAVQRGADDAEGSFDAAKVKRIGQAIRDGEYRANPEAIADKLIANALELLGKPQT